MEVATELGIEIKELREQIDSFNLEDHEDLTEQYNEMLDGVYGEFMNMYASHILKSTDPIAYRCGYSDYVDGLDLESFECYTDLIEKLEELEGQLEDLN